MMNYRTALDGEPDTALRTAPPEAEYRADLATVQVVNFNLTDEELEEHIASCGRLMRVAFSEGRREDAYGWMDRMNEAIKSRSPEQVKKMERERFGCYFAAGGQEVK